MSGANLHKRGKSSVVLIVAAAVVLLALLVCGFIFVPRLLSKMSSSDGADAGKTAGAFPAGPPPVIASVEQDMDAYFGKIAKTPPAAVRVEDYEGRWQGKLVSLDLINDLPVDPSEAAAFAFTIKRDGEDWQLLADGSKSAPRSVTAAETGCIARAPNRADLHLSLDGKTLRLWFFESKSKSNRRAEFHATRHP